MRPFARGAFAHHDALLAEMGARVAPIIPAFYNHPQSADDIIIRPSAGCSICAVSKPARSSAGTVVRQVASNE